ncbi:TPA: type VI secretion system tip protein VgrG [Salmonella enterica subsp. arizonae serovar 13,22:z4,z23:-]|uniref:Rhs-family protein n=1 Tax=Salmonella enterica subsp. arizonae TaxID=59203 RepID=A0A379SLV1_SALER|nr:type VI secretion system tip protein VgrG [Salmonella enterica]SUG30529.1 Rhs-family protein [Salmonella enterica subsp. arizonae]HBJ6280635.1 type VI secretion system tip protein VgrG [Salmonella enterica subsp. arizonae serovar 13,22:z4,z23:-]EAS9679483.1 type VI secretion system tip protein VgrG [Salmonella enterica]EAX5088361.1 type VI secretion system tip protein VgrG [Salmonella enterica]
MDNWSALFDGQTRYGLDINDSTVKADVLRFRGREALSEPFNWDIEFTTLQANIPPEQVLMKYASFRMRSGKNVHGMVTRLEWLSTSRDQSHYQLTLSSRLALMGYTRQCAVYQNQSVPEVVEQVLRKHGLEGPDFEFRLERTYPPRELITQWRETDLQFIQRILSEVGIYWRTMMDDVRDLDTYIFADSQLNYQFDVQLPYSEPSGLFDGAAESVWDVRTWHNIATGTVATRNYNYRTATTPMDATVSVRNDAVTTGEHYRYAAPYRVAGDDASPEPETESGAFYARIHHERELNRSARIHLFSNAAHLTPGQVLEPQGQRRGTGAELRTDEWGTIRAGKGLFVSADAQAKAQGEVLDMDAALKEIDRLNQQLQQLEMAAEKAQALKADVDSQIQMFEQRLKPLSEALLMSAPEGMALTSGEHLQMTATKNVAMNAGGDFSAGVMGNMTALAGEKLGLFARTGQLSMKASEGPVEMQAQNASMRLFAEKKLTLSSASDISFAGKKRITLVGGGSYLRLEAGKVEYGTTATYLRRVKRTMFADAHSTPTSSVLMPLVEDLIKDGFFDEQFRILNDSGKPMANVPYFISTESGKTFKGVTDNQGLCKRVFSKEASKLTVWLGVQALERW